jgi:AbiV family abortive infection protein
MSDEANFALIYNNALRLLEDAELLFDSARYASSTALALFCIEEAGKFIIAVRDDDPRFPRSRDIIPHKIKQAELGVAYWQLALWDVMTDEFNRLKGWLQTRKEADADEYLIYLSSLKSNEAVQHMISVIGKSDPERVERLIRGKYPHRDRLDHLERALSGQLDRSRKSAIYVDLKPNGQPTSDPFTLGPDEAAEWLEDARVAVVFAQMWGRMQNVKGLITYEP